VGAIDDLLDQIYAGHERISRDEIYRHAVAAELPARALTALDALPEGEYAQDEIAAAVAEIAAEADGGAETDGVADGQA
jgi:hypothetical protein